MKKYIFIIIIFMSSHFCSVMSWDTTAAKYLPLQVGNIWVYYGSYSFPIPPFHQIWYDRYKITGVLDTNGQRYYKFQLTTVGISQKTDNIYFISSLRIDSLSMNVYALSTGSACSPFESFVDSLRSKKNDTAGRCSQTFRLCVDTNTYNIFGVNIPAKKFTNDRQNSYTTYAKGIGIVFWGWAELQNNYSETLLGCIINGVIHGDTSLTGIEKISWEIPDIFFLYQNYPNPFNPTTSIKFSVPQNAFVTISTYNVLGEEISKLVSKEFSPGIYETNWDGTNYPSGIYYYRLTLSSEQLTKYTETKKMVLIK